MVGEEAFVIGDAMVAEEGGTSELRNTSTAQQSPKSSISKTNNEIWVNRENFIGEPIELGFKFPADEFAFDKRWVSGDAIGFAPAEVFEVVAGWMEGEDVGAVEFGVEFPYGVDETGVGLVVIAVEVGLIGFSPFENASF